MSEPLIGEIRMLAGNLAPRGWAFCDGQILPINQNQSLYALLGTTYGGDGCLGSGSSGSDVAFSFGTTSSVTYGNRIIMRITFKNSSVTALTGITFSPTL